MQATIYPPDLNVIDPETADPGVDAVGLAAPAAAAARAGAGAQAVPIGTGRRTRAGAFARFRADAERMRAVRDVWFALWTSRLLAWGAGIATVLALGFGPSRKAFNPHGVTSGLGAVGNVLAAPVARWDSAWYLVIARWGYRPDLGSFTAARSAFFPLYPLGIKVLSWLDIPAIGAGVAISVAALAGALYGIHRLTTLELGGSAQPRVASTGGHEQARLAVLITAFAPMAFFFSAVYSEALYLALSVGMFWAARQGRWALAGVLGGLAAATRSTGVVLLLPALIFCLYGPRADRGIPVRRRRRFMPRYRPRVSELAWLSLILLGAAAFSIGLALAGGDALAPYRAQQNWSRHFAGPYLGVWDGLKAAFEGARQLLSFQTAHVYFPDAIGNPKVTAEHNLIAVAFLLVAVPALVAVARRLPAAYAAYTVAALALPLSYPVSAEPLMSLPRFLVVLFPLSIASGAWLAEHPRWRRPLLALSAALLVVFSAGFSTWHWVA